MIKNILRLINMAGFILSRKGSSLAANRIKLIDHYGIDVILDVGANSGQYAETLRDYGYKGRIISFEPILSVYNELKKKANRDPLWDTYNLALGASDGSSNINISKNTCSSSILEILPEHVRSAPKSVYIGTESIDIRRLDTFLDRNEGLGGDLFLKIDTQGYEKKVLEGAGERLDRIRGIQIEVSLTPLYQSETLFLPMINYILERGFNLMGLDPGFTNPETGQLLQVDCTFFRT